MNKLFFILITSILTFSSCSLFKKNVEIEGSLNTVNNSQELINKVNSQNISPEWISLNSKIKINKEEQETTINTQIRVRKDSVIWISVRAPLGIEVFRSMITPDSIYFMSRIDKTYFIKPISHLKKTVKADINYFQLQEILYASPKITNKNLNFSDSPPFSLYSKKENYFVNSLFYRIEKMEIIESDKKKIIINFYNYQPQEEFSWYFPDLLKIDVQSDEIFKSEINYTKIEFNKKTKMSFNIPKSYVEIQ